MALHHKLCHTLGGAFGLPHAETHAILLPYAVRYNEAAAPVALQRVAEALEADDAATALYRLAARVGAPVGLKAIGMPRDGIDRATDLACANPYWNPRPLEREAIRGLIRSAFEGAAP
jgi:maleylacetate reductase